MLAVRDRWRHNFANSSGSGGKRTWGQMTAKHAWDARALPGEAPLELLRFSCGAGREGEDAKRGDDREPPTPDFLPVGKVQPICTILPAGRKMAQNSVDRTLGLVISLESGDAAPPPGRREES